MRSLRESFGHLLLEFAETHDDFFVLDADVAGGTCTHWFRKKYRDRFIQCGIAEQNMTSMAAGMSTLGVTPIVTAYGVFASMRALEQVRNSIGYPNFNVKIVASHLGVDAGPDGATHQSVEDLAIFRSLPNFTVLSPCDEQEMRGMMEWMLESMTPVYMRSGRSGVPEIHNEDYQFEMGMPDVLNEGSDVVVFATGITVHRALKAAKELEGVMSVKVVNIHTLKPLFSQEISAVIGDTRHIITVEDHSVINGLGTAIAEVMAETGVSGKLKKLGIQDVYGESGDPEELAELYGISTGKIVEAIREITE